MGRIVVTEYMSLDGVVEAPSGTESFERVGWTDAYHRGPEGDEFKLEEARAADAFLYGRVTYEGFAPVWPKFKGELADTLNTLPKYVVSSTLENPEWNNTTVIRGNVLAEISKLKNKYQRDIVIFGSGQLVQTIIEHDLLDALHLQVYPVIVGAGKRLFGETSTSKRLRLAETKTFGDVHSLIYERVPRSGDE